MSSVELQPLLSIVTILQSLFFILSVFLIWYQIRQHNRFTQASITQPLFVISSPF